MKNACYRAWAVWCVLLLTGCPESGPPAEGNGTNNASTVSNEERLASLDEVEQLIAPFELNGDPAISQQIGSLLSARADVAVVKVLVTGSVVARFTDGELLVVINNRPTSDTPEPDPSLRRLSKPISKDRSAAAGLSPRTQSLIRVASTDPDQVLVPESRKAVLINAMGNAFKDDTPEFSFWFASSGYDVTQSDGTIESLRDDVKDVGVLYISSHGSLMPPSAVPDELEEVLEGVAETPAPTAGLALEAPARDHFVIWTKTVITNETIEQYRSQVTSGRMAYLFASNNKDANGKATNGRHFGITEVFVYENWTCKPGALIYMDCCESANGKIVDVCMSDQVNAGAYIGWTYPTWFQYSSSSARYFFDRTLGVNSYSKETPPQRPFSARRVQEMMTQRDRHGLDTDPFITKTLNLDLKLDQSITTDGVKQQLGISTSDLMFFFRLDDCVLRPGITELRVVINTDQSSTLIADGAFGDVAGTVTVGGVNCPVKPDGWKKTQIQCELANSGPGSSGPVVVKGSERQSNPRTLTQWDLTLRRTFMDYPTQASTDCPSCFYEATLHYTIRADAGPTRQNLDGPVSPRNFTGAADKGDIEVTNAGGTYSIGQGSSITLAPNPDDGAAFIGTCLGFLPPEDNNYLGACFFVEGSQNQITFRPTIFAEGLLRNYHDGQFDGVVDLLQVVYFGNIEGNQLILPLSPNFNIAAGNKSTGPNSFFEWDGANAQHPPDPNAPQ